MPSESPRSGAREPSSWEHYGLWRRVRRALFAVPDRFASPTRIEGLLVQDLFTLNAPLAATIEEQVVETLNRMRAVWDPDGAYETYAFERQSQTFPDVILRRTGNGSEILLGIELKGWYLLASEGVPTYRFTTTAAACNPWDLLVVVPWVLADVLSGSPVLHPPFVESARLRRTAERVLAGRTDGGDGRCDRGPRGHSALSGEERSDLRQAGPGRRPELREARPLRHHGRLPRTDAGPADSRDSGEGVARLLQEPVVVRLNAERNPGKTADGRRRRAFRGGGACGFG